MAGVIGVDEILSDEDECLQNIVEYLVQRPSAVEVSYSCVGLLNPSSVLFQ